MKAAKDEMIYRRVLRLRQYQQSSVLLCYVSTPMEVDTHILIRDALSRGMRVAVPRCIENTRRMDFYYVRSFPEDLASRTFGVLEPILERCEKALDFSDSLCILPGLAFDHFGYRLGYGAGYYDRFLQTYEGPKIGLVYSEFVRYKLVHGRYDLPCDLLVTEKYIRNTSARHSVH